MGSIIMLLIGIFVLPLFVVFMLLVDCDFKIEDFKKYW